MRATREVITPVWDRHVWYLVKLFFVVDEAGVKALADSRGRLDEQQMACYLCELELTEAAVITLQIPQSTYWVGHSNWTWAEKITFTTRQAVVWPGVEWTRATMVKRNGEKPKREKE